MIKVIFCKVIVLTLSIFIVFLAAEKRTVLLYDTLSALEYENGFRTTAETISGVSGGIITGKAEIKETPKKKVLRLNGLSCLKYPAEGNINFSEGELSFRFAVNYNPNEENEKTKTVLRNQIFFSVTGPGRSRFTVYNSGKDVFRIGVFDADGKTALLRTVTLFLLPGSWHEIRLVWGDELVLYIDGEEEDSVSWSGLWGNIAADTAQSAIIIGADPVYVIHSEFDISELKILDRDPEKKQRSALISGPDLVYYRPRTHFTGYPPYAHKVTPSPWQDVTDHREAQRIMALKEWPQDEAAATAMAEYYHTLGITALLATDRYLFKDDPAEPVPSLLRGGTFEDMLKGTKLITKALHKKGIKFIHHPTSTMVSAGFMSAHPQWATVDIITGKPYLTNAYGTGAVCFMHDDFMKIFLARLIRIYTETDTDGIMQDELQFWGPSYCGCSACRTSFKSETGYTIPESGKGFLYQFLNPEYQAWLEWRRRKVTEALMKVRAIVKKRNPANTIYAYQAGNSASYPTYGCGLTINDQAAYTDFLGLEAEPNDKWYQYYWPLAVFEIKYLDAVNRRINSPMWTLFYNKTTGDVTWTWILGMTMGTRLWWFLTDDAKLSAGKPLLAWEEKHEQLLMHNHSAANIGVLYSIACRDYNPVSRQHKWHSGFSAVCNALTFARIPYRVIIDEDMNEKDLSMLRTLILCDAVSLSDAQTDGVRGFVRNGGLLIASGDVSRANERGVWRSNFALSDVLGVSYLGENVSRSVLTIPASSPRTGNISGEFRHREPFVLITNTVSDIKIEGMMRTLDGMEYPGIVTRNFGKGSVIYFTGHPEQRFFYYNYNLNLYKPGSKWRDVRDMRWAELFCKIAVQRNPDIPFRIENLPEGVIAEAYVHNMQGMKGLVVHCANMAGGIMKTGLVPMNHEINYPDVMKTRPNPNKPIEISVHAPETKTLFAISPDWDAVIELPFKKADRRIIAEIPMLYRHVLLYFSSGDESYIRALYGGTVKDLPALKKLIISEDLPLCGVYNASAGIAFADTPAFIGGKDFNWYKGEPCRIAYGTESGNDVITIKIIIPGKIKKPVLDIGGMDDNRENSKAPLVVTLNGYTVLKEENSYPDAQWAVQSFQIKPFWAAEGENTVVIRNTGPGTTGTTPWFAAAFVRIRPE